MMCRYCKFVCKTPRSKNWKLYSCCFVCMKIVIEGKRPDHGTGRGSALSKEEVKSQSMLEASIIYDNTREKHKARTSNR